VALGPFEDGAPDANTHIRNVFYRLGFSNTEIVALCGAHTLGRAFKDRRCAQAIHARERSTIFVGAVVSSTMHQELSTLQSIRRLTCKSLPMGSQVCKQRPSYALLSHVLANYMPGGCSWTEQWLVFDNSYFTRTLTHADDPHLVWLPMDTALAGDPEFVSAFERYCKDQRAFFTVRFRAFLRYSRGGFHPVTECRRTMPSPIAS
jgi:L-ascorbate peroxidase